MQAALRRRLWFWTPPLLVVLAALFWLFRPQPVAVDLVTAQRGPLLVTVSDDGETRVKDVFVVSAPVPGLMRRIELEAGDPVVAEQTIVARIEPNDPAFLDRRSSAEASAALRAAEAARTHAAAEVRRVQAELDFAQAELRRYEGLVARAAVSQNDLDSARRRAATAAAALQESRAGLRVSESEVDQARARLVSPGGTRAVRADCECVLVHSPVSGSVLRVLKESEGVVEAATPLVEVGDPRRLEVVVDLLSTDAVRVVPGQKVLIEGWGGARPLDGVVRRVEPFGFTKVSALGVEEQRVNVVIDFAGNPEDWAGLGHGFRVEPRIVLWSAPDVLKVPLSALFREGKDWRVFREEGGRAVAVPVEVGHDNGLEAEVLKGLEPGQRVVVHPSERVVAGGRITQRQLR
ncbi:MAG TPA: HlyD family efflux transporter periplasmic adaptor subunit [Steroidobacteraceae bacterium]